MNEPLVDNQKTDLFDAKSEAGEMESAGFWIRFVAICIDSICLWIVNLPIQLVYMAFFGEGLFPEIDPNAMDPSSQVLDPSFWTSSAILYVIQLSVTGSIYGYMYSRMGATPGKLLLKLQVIDSNSGNFVGFWRGFFRDTLGKLISSLVMLIGYIMAAFTKEKKALHDYMFTTRVIYKRR